MTKTWDQLDPTDVKCCCSTADYSKLNISSLNRLRSQIQPCVIELNVGIYSLWHLSCFHRFELYDFVTPPENAVA